jgi:hypothetical protein
MILNTFRKYSKLELLKPGETRFATQFIMLDRLKYCKQAVVNCYIDPSLAESVSAKSQSYKDLFKVAKDLIFDPKFWKDVDYIHSIMEPIILLLRLTDNDNKIPVGFVGILYHKYYTFTIHVANFMYRNRNQRNDIVKLVDDRWVELHSPLHSAGFCVHPAYQVFHQHTNEDVWKDLLYLLDRWCDLPTKKSILAQFIVYRERRGIFSRDVALGFDVSTDDPIAWWSNFGCEVPQLQAFAIKVLSQCVTASPCETNWSLYEWIVNKRRNRLSVEKQKNLVYVNANLRFVNKL